MEDRYQLFWGLQYNVDHNYAFVPLDVLCYSYPVNRYHQRRKSIEYCVLQRLQTIYPYPWLPDQDYFEIGFCNDKYRVRHQVYVLILRWILLSPRLNQLNFHEGFHKCHLNLHKFPRCYPYIFQLLELRQQY